MNSTRVSAIALETLDNYTGEWETQTGTRRTSFTRSAIGASSEPFGLLSFTCAFSAAMMPALRCANGVVVADAADDADDAEAADAETADDDAADDDAADDDAKAVPRCISANGLSLVEATEDA